MPRKTENQQARGAAKAKHLTSAARRGRRIARTLGQSTLLAAGIAFTQLGFPEVDPRFHVFDPTLVDRLQPPITRRHE